MPAPKRPNTAAATEAAAVSARRRREETMAAKLRATGRWLVVAEPRCATCGGDLDSMGDMTICVKCGDEFEDIDALWSRAIAEARKDAAPTDPGRYTPPAGDKDRIDYAGPTGRERPGEHWNARVIRERAEAAKDSDGDDTEA